VEDLCSTIMELFGAIGDIAFAVEEEEPLVMEMLRGH
jgi:hypothetical protein